MLCANVKIGSLKWARPGDFRPSQHSNCRPNESQVYAEFKEMGLHDKYFFRKIINLVHLSDACDSSHENDSIYSPMEVRIPEAHYSRH